MMIELLIAALAGLLFGHLLDLAFVRFYTSEDPATPLHHCPACRSPFRMRFASPLTGYVIEGLALDLNYPLEHLTPKHLQQSAIMSPAIPPDLRPAWRRGQGIQCGRLLRRGFAADVERIRSGARTIPVAERGDFWFGVGWGLGEGRGTGALTAEPWAWMPTEQRGAALQGLGAALRHQLGIGASEGLGDDLSGDFGAADLRALSDGMRWLGYPLPYSL